MSYLPEIIRYPSRYGIPIPSFDDAEKSLQWLQKPTLKRGFKRKEYDLYTLTPDGSPYPISFSLATEKSMDVYYAPLPSMKILGMMESFYERHFFWWNTYWLDNESPRMMLDTLYTIKDSRKSVTQFLFRCILNLATEQELYDYQEQIEIVQEYLAGSKSARWVTDQMSWEDEKLSEHINKCVVVTEDNDPYIAEILSELLVRVAKADGVHLKRISDEKRRELEMRVCDLMRTHYPLPKLMKTLSRYTP